MWSISHEPGLIAEPDSLLDPISWLCYTISPLFDDVDVSEQCQNKVVWNVYHAHENDCVLCADILRRPGMLEGVWDAVTVMCPGWNTRM